MHACLPAHMLYGDAYADKAALLLHYSLTVVLFVEFMMMVHAFSCLLAGLCIMIQGAACVGSAQMA